MLVASGPETMVKGNSHVMCFRAGWIFWPVANIFNFIFIPPHLRLP